MGDATMDCQEMLREYRAGSALLRAAICDLTEAQLDARPVAGKWSTRQVVCHIADFESIYADRMKRVLVEDQPTLLGGDPDAFALGLAYDQRDVAEELDLIYLVRKQMARILDTLDPEDFQRQGIHTKAGPLTLEVLLQRITGHIPHHVRFIEEKKAALA